jgi:hypothetical protein
MASTTSPTIARHISAIFSPIKPSKNKVKVGSAAYMKARGFRRATKAESEQHSKFVA